MVGTLRWFLMGLCLGVVPFSVLLAADDVPSGLDSNVLIHSGEIEITAEEVLLYLEWLTLNRDAAIEDLSGQRVSQAIIELYALKTLNADAEKTPLYSSGLAAWLPEYLLTVNRVDRFIALSVDNAMRATDWESEARELYLVNLNEFVVPETITLRTLLLRTETRSSEEALELAHSLLADRLPEQSFESLVVQYSEDKVGRAAGGLMENVVRGQTVPSFEEAAFSLSEPGQLSDPVLSDFGVHLIQLVSKSPARTKTFEEASYEIVSRLKQTREAEYRETIQNEARMREPAGYQINEPAIDAFMNSLGHTKLGDPKAPQDNE